MTPVPVATTSVDPASKLGKTLAVISALLPLLEVGATPFIKDPATSQIIADETPVAQALFAALSAL